MRPRPPRIEVREITYIFVRLGSALEGRIFTSLGFQPQAEGGRPLAAWG